MTQQPPDYYSTRQALGVVGPSSYPLNLYLTPGIGSYVSTGRSFYVRTPRTEIPQLPVLPSVIEEKEQQGTSAPHSFVPEVVTSEVIEKPTTVPERTDPREEAKVEALPPPKEVALAAPVVPKRQARKRRVELSPAVITAAQLKAFGEPKKKSTRKLKPPKFAIAQA